MNQGDLKGLLQMALEPEQQPEADTAPDATDSPAHFAGVDAPGSCVGPYRLLEMLGEGGFGTVWRAEQTVPIKRQVALKISKGGLDTRQVTARFNAERQVLALMVHPGIATVYDAGSTPDGRPYFVMELVEGQPITTYCSERNLPVKDRLELFVQACHAVQHAHQKGILHRDLKPNNILVTEVDGKPVPKIIDFGIARVIDQTASMPFNALLTRHDMLLGTPAYMSPEQAILGNPDLDTRTDIYSLGVILYELLTGQTPLGTVPQHRTTSLDQMLRSVQQDRPARPSNQVQHSDSDQLHHSGANPLELRRQIKGDLDWITLKALEKNRDQRYDSADALAKDVINHLNHLPISAGRGTLAQAAAKFIRRNRGAVAAAAAIFLTLILAAGFSISAYFDENRMRRLADELRIKAEEEEAKAEQQRDKALASEKAAIDERQKAQATLNYLSKLLELTGDYADKGKNPEALRLALDSLSGEIDQFSSSPEVRQIIEGKTALIYRYLKDDKNTLLHARKQLESLEKTHPENDPDLLEARKLYAKALHLDGHIEESHRQFDELVRQWETRLDTKDGPRLLFLARNERAEVWTSNGRLKEALAEFEDMLENVTEEIQNHSMWPVFLRRYARALTEAKRPREAADIYSKALEDLDLSTSKQQHYASTLLHGQSRLYASLADMTAATRTLEKAVELQQTARGEYSPWLAEWWIELSRLYTAARRHSEAIAVCQKTVNTLLTTGQEDKLAHAHRAMGDNFLAAAMLAQASTAYFTAANHQTLSPDPPMQAWLDLASAMRCASLHGDHEAALTHFSRLEVVFPEWHAQPQDETRLDDRLLADLAYTRLALAEAGIRNGAPDMSHLAEALALPVIQSFIKLQGHDSIPEYQKAGQILADAQGRRADALLHSSDFLALCLTHTERWSSTDHAADLMQLAAALRLAGRHRAAVEIYHLAAAMNQADAVVKDRRHGALLMAAETLHRLGEPEKAGATLAALKTKHESGEDRITDPLVLQRLELGIDGTALTPLTSQTPSPSPPPRQAGGGSAASP